MGYMRRQSYDILKNKKIGKNVIIRDTVIIYPFEDIEIGDYSRIEDFSKIVVGKGVKLGRYNHVNLFCSITGGEGYRANDFVTFSPNCHILTRSDDYINGVGSPFPGRRCICGEVIVERYVILGTGTTVLPGVTIGEGAATGAFTLVTKDLEPWTLYIGIPARKYKMRNKKNVLTMVEKKDD